MTLSETEAREQLPERLDDVVYPTASTPVVAERRVANRAVTVPTFEEDVWSLASLEEDAARVPSPLNFRRWHVGFREFAKHTAYALINYGNPPALVERRGSNYAEWPSASTIQQFITDLRTQVDWLTSSPPELFMDYPITTPADLDSEHLNSLRRRLEKRGYGARVTNKRLEMSLRVWHLSPWLPETERWPEPEWSETNWRAPRKNEETRTKRIPQAVMGPLLEWATSFVSLFADDIFAAHRHHNDWLETQNTPKRGASIEALEEYVRDGRPLPVDPMQPGRVSWQAVQYQSRVPVNRNNLAVAFKRQFRGKIAAGGDVTRLRVDPTAKFHGEQWVPSLFLHEVTPRKSAVDDLSILLGHLRTACLIVCAYLTGARPEEVLGFAEGAAREPIVRPSGAVLHLVDGLRWKGRTRTESSAYPPEPATWATIPVTSEAIRVAEEINRVVGRPGGPLFVSPGVRMLPDVASNWIKSFVSFVNTRLVPHTQDPAGFTIPDIGGRLTLRRFRRTLAWFITNLPNGEVTTAIQYQHVSDRLVSGYAGTKESGMRDLLLEEDWKHRRQTIENVHEILDSGQRLYGPAAARATTTVLGMPRFMTPADERRLKKEGAFILYDNPSALVICAFDEPQALCVKVRRVDGRHAPNLPGCVDVCPNAVRTEAQLTAIEDEAVSLRDNAALSPQPIAQSMLAMAENKEKVVRDARSGCGE